MISDESNSYLPATAGMPRPGCFLHGPIPGFLTVIIPVYKDVEGLAVTLGSLLTQTIPESACEVLVANDGADPGVTALCGERKVREIVLRINQGSYAARNAALAEARGEFIAFADADVRIDPRWCEAGLEALAGADLVAGKTVIDLAGTRATAALYQFCFAFPAKHYAREWGMAQTVNLFVRRGTFEEAGFFDDRLRSGGDLEWSMRATRDAGKSLVYDERAVVCHPPRNYAQILASSERILYGQENAKRLHGGNEELIRGTTKSGYRNLLPPSPRSMRWMREAGLSPTEFIKVYFFSWWLKVRTLFTVWKVRSRCRNGALPAGRPLAENEASRINQ